MDKRVVRKRPRTSIAEGASHFLAPSKSLDFIKSGCTLLDLVLGGGWPLGRISNIVGDKSTGKTLLAIEACANFVRDYPKARIWYAEGEAAFDKDYAEALGMPVQKVKFSEPDTVEEFEDHLKKQIDWCNRTGRPGLYILDSLDALSDDKEMALDRGKASYGTSKAKQMSQMFRKLVRQVKRANIHVCIISQVRDNIGISFGRKTKRSGGKALDFYASQVLYLAHLGDVTRRKKGQKRVTAIRVRAKCDKNKIGLPRRECEFTIRFGYGVDDIRASLDFLGETKELKRADIESKHAADKLLEELDSIDNATYRGIARAIKGAVKQVWEQTERDFLPKRRKYG